MSTQISIHGADRLVAKAKYSNGTAWLTIQPLGSDGDAMTEITLFFDSIVSAHAYADAINSANAAPVDPTNPTREPSPSMENR